MLKKILLIFIFTILIVACIKAEENIENKHFKSAANTKNISIKKGENGIIKLTLSFEKSWYIYSFKEQIGPEGIGPIPTLITLEPADLIEISGKVKVPKPRVKYDKGFEMDVEYYKDKIVFEIPFIAKKDIDISKDKIYAVVSAQQCTDEKCLPPEDFKTLVKGLNTEEEVTDSKINGNDALSLNEEQGAANDEFISDSSKPTAIDSKNVDIGVGTKKILNNDNKENTDDESDENNGKSRGILGFLIISMAAGAGALLTPCVFPMVPITVSFFTKRTEKAKGKGLRDALIYALGIIISFTLLGFFFSLIFGATGIQEFAKNPWVYLFIAAIFVVFAFNLLGAFELQLPTGLINKIDTKSRQGSGITSVLLMSLTFSLASFSCTGPLVSAALIAAASGQWFYPIISMVGFSAVLAAPFFLLALFPTAMNFMPKAGGWMNNVKGVLGFIVIATSLYFISSAFAQWEINFLNRDLFLSVLIGISFLTTLYILGVFKFTHDTQVERISTLRMIFALIFATLTFYLITGLMGKSLGELETFLPQSEKTSTALIKDDININTKWIENYDEAIAEAKRTNKSIFIDFTGKSCTNCKKMEKTIFPLKSVQDRMNKMVRLKLITDVRREPFVSNKKLQQSKFHSIEIPMYVILSPDEKVIAKAAYTPNIKDFISFLEKGIAND